MWGVEGDREVREQKKREWNAPKKMGEEEGRRRQRNPKGGKESTKRDKEGKKRRDNKRKIGKARKEQNSGGLLGRDKGV